MVPQAVENDRQHVIRCGILGHKDFYANHSNTTIFKRNESNEYTFEAHERKTP